LAIGAILSEVGSEHRKEVFETIDRHINDSIVQHGSVREGVDYIVGKVRERMPKTPPKAADNHNPLDDGAEYQPSIAQPKDGLLAAIRARKLRKWGPYGRR
jgi:ribosomal protein S30